MPRYTEPVWRLTDESLCDHYQFGVNVETLFHHHLTMLRPRHKQQEPDVEVSTHYFVNVFTVSQCAKVYECKDVFMVGQKKHR